MLTRGITIVVITENVLARVDMRPGRAFAVTGSWSQQKPSELSREDSLRYALDLSSRPAAKVWLLTDQVWNGVVNLPNEFYGALSETQLTQALGLEAEVLSGFSAFDCLTSHKWLPSFFADRREVAPEFESDRQYWVSQLPKSVAIEAEQVVKEVGGKLVGIGSPLLLTPGNLVDSLSAVEAANGNRQWQLVQCVDSLCVQSMGRGDQVSQVQVTEHEPVAGEAERLGEKPSAENDGILRVHICDHNCGCSAQRISLDFRDSDSAASFSSAWMIENGIPGSAGNHFVLGGDLQQRRKMFVVAAVFMIAVASCLGHYINGIAAIRECASAITVKEDRAKRVATQQAEIRQSTIELERAREEFAKNQSVRMIATQENRHDADRFELLRTRSLQVLEALSKSSGNDVWIQSIHQEDDSTAVTGIAANAASVHHFGNLLELHLEGTAWTALPPSIVRSDVHFVRFEFLMHQVLKVDQAVPQAFAGLQFLQRADSIARFDTDVENRHDY